MGTPSQNKDKKRRLKKWLLKGRKWLFRGGVPLIVTIVLFYASSVIAEHQHDLDVKQNLVESISNSASDAFSTALELGSGDIVHEATSSQPASALIQQRHDQALRDWRQESGLMQFEIDTYYGGQAREELDNAWQHAENMVVNLVLISGQLYTTTDRAQVLKYLQNNLGSGSGLNNPEWAALDTNPGCYPSNDCPGSFRMEFTAASQALVRAVQTYLAHNLVADIVQNNTVFQPMPCRDLHIC